MRSRYQPLEQLWGAFSDAYIQPDYIAPIVGYLSSKGQFIALPGGRLSDLRCTDNKDTTGSLFEITGGWAAQTRWQRSGGHCFPNDKPYTPEDVLAEWDIITNFCTPVTR